jgi:paraquat-inducible protein B
MASKANPATIGAFVVGAVGLAIVGAVVFGSGQLFKKTLRVVSFFSGDVTGLNVGAPVKFKGVDVGSVTGIRIRIPEEHREVTSAEIASGIRIPVLMEIDEQQVVAQGALPLTDPKRVRELIDLGLRAQLVSQSMVTGLLLVRLDFQPDVPAVFVLPPDADIPEIPTVPTSLAQLQAALQTTLHKLEDIDLKKLVDRMTSAIEGVDDIVRAPGLKDAIAALPRTVAGLNETMATIRTLVTGLDQRQGPLLQSLHGTSERAAESLQELRATLASAQDVLDPNAPLMVDLVTSLREIAAAARSVRLLADYLERNPSAIVRGREVQGK